MPQTAQFTGSGWKVKVQRKRGNYHLTIVKELILGNLLKKGDHVYYYSLLLEDGRKAILTLMDGEPIEEVEEMVIRQ